MLRVLPWLWFLLAVLGLAAQLAVAFSAAPGASYTLGSSLPAAALGAVSACGMGLVYMLIGRTRPSVPVGIIGFSHLFMALAARIAGTLAEFQRGRYMADPAGNDATTMALTYSAAGLASFLAGIVFILALIVALNTRHVRPEDIF